MMGHLGPLSIFFLSLSFSLYCSETVNEYDDRTTYIVRVQNDLKPSVFPDVEEWYKATLESLVDSNPLLNTENSKPTQKILHVYKTVFHGFSAKLTTQQAKQLLDTPEVIALLPDSLLQLHTTWSPTFLGLYNISSDNNNNYNDINKPGRLLSESDSGADVIIGVLDTGIWPERLSFKDQGLGLIPPKWKGECVGGPNFTKDNCNNKLIGARLFYRGYEAAQIVKSTEEFNSARDSNGHGTHTASTAAGIAVEQANLLGYANGTAVGVAPKARIAAYKVCWEGRCMESDVLAGFDKAVEDGVDVISISIGGSSTSKYDQDLIAIGAFGAMEKGVSVIASAGNAGPRKSSVTNVAPWMTAVGASTTDRGFPAALVLGDGRVINGMSLYNGKPLPKDVNYPLIYGELCEDSSSSLGDVRDKIVVCDRGGDSGRAQKGEAVRKANGTGVVVANVNDMGQDLFADAHVIPGLDVTESARLTIIDYINHSSKPTATMLFHGTEFGIKPSPVVASFSARGPNHVSAYVLKPDLIAPGVNILGAWPDGVGPTELPSDGRQIEFNVVSGTSMSCPHVAGVAALLKGAHPDWSPAMIRSAMMTTAYFLDKQGNPILDDKDSNKAESTAWAMGAGQVNPEKAVDPGLVYDISADDYVDFLCASGYNRIYVIRTITRNMSTSCDVNKQSLPWDLNYPAISVEFNKSQTTDREIVVSRTATYVGDHIPATYSVTVTQPRSGIINVTVNPVSMEFNVKGEKKSYSVRIKATSAPVEDMDEGKIVWSDGQREAVSPVVVAWA